MLSLCIFHQTCNKVILSSNILAGLNLANLGDFFFFLCVLQSEWFMLQLFVLFWTNLFDFCLGSGSCCWWWFYCWPLLVCFYLQSIARRHLFSDTVLLNVTDRNGTEIASTQVLVYRCRTVTRCVHVRQNVFLLIN